MRDTLAALQAMGDGVASGEATGKAIVSLISLAWSPLPLSPLWPGPPFSWSPLAKGMGEKQQVDTMKQQVPWG